MENGHAELTRLLLSYGADPTLTTYSGQRPADLTTDSVCLLLVLQHLSDLTGIQAAYWDFCGPARLMGEI
jgi:hypothetical protein